MQGIIYLAWHCNLAGYYTKSCAVVLALHRIYMYEACILHSGVIVQAWRWVVEIQIILYPEMLSKFGHKRSVYGIQARIHIAQTEQTVHPSNRRFQ